MLPEPLVAGDGVIVPGVGKDPSRTNHSPLLSTHSDTERETMSLLRPRALKSHATGSCWRQKPKQSKADERSEEREQIPEKLFEPWGPAMSKAHVTSMLSGRVSQ